MKMKSITGVVLATLGVGAACTLCCIPLIATLASAALAALGVLASVDVRLSWPLLGLGGLTLVALRVGLRWLQPRRCLSCQPAYGCSSACQT